MRVRDVMTQDVATVAPDTDLRDLAALLVERRISGVPVVENGRVVGVVSERDILFKERPSDGLSRGVLARLMDEGDLTLKIDARTAREAMTSPPLTIATFPRRSGCSGDHVGRERFTPPGCRSRTPRRDRHAA